MTIADLALWLRWSTQGLNTSYLLRRRVWGTSHTLDRTCLELEYSAGCPLWSFKPTARGKQKDSQSKDFTSVRLTLGARTGEVYHTGHSQKKDEGISNPTNNDL